MNLYFDASLIVALQTTDVVTTRAAAASRRRLDITLRTADALNIAIVQRIGATLMAFDEKMALAAKAFGVDVATA